LNFLLEDWVNSSNDWVAGTSPATPAIPVPEQAEQIFHFMATWKPNMWSYKAHIPELVE
jgi:hypothetical protein